MTTTTKPFSFVVTREREKERGRPEKSALSLLMMTSSLESREGDNDNSCSKEGTFVNNISRQEDQSPNQVMVSPLSFLFSL